MRPSLASPAGGSTWSTLGPAKYWAKARDSDSAERREPIETRKATLLSVLRGSRPGLQFKQHLAHPGDVVFRHACKMGLEGIVSKRLGSPYRLGRARDWLKFKNLVPAVTREAEEDWGR
jgi:bifunctional non-homologous end joining protein LigD